MEKFNRKFRANGRLIRWMPLVRDVNLSVYKAVRLLRFRGFMVIENTAVCTQLKV